MPILKHNRERYPTDWPEIAFAIKDANDWCCQACELECLKPDEPTAALSKAERARRTLTISHYDNVYDAPEVFLAALCTACHLQHDAQFQPAARQRNHRIRQRQAGQLELALQGGTH